MSPAEKPDRVVLELTGSEAQRGLPLANLASFVDDFRRALIDFDRQRRAEPTRRSGALNVREELVTSFRVVELRPGSAVLTLEPIPPAITDETQAMIEGAELLSLQTLRSLLGAIEDESTLLDPAVAESLSAARRDLGDDGTIAIQLSNGERRPRRVVVDGDRIARLKERVRKTRLKDLRVSGRLHRIELEPDKIGIRTASGVNWTCRYPAELEPTIIRLVDQIVWARGVGAQQSAQRGTLTIEEIHQVDQFEQTPLFTEEHLPLEDLLLQQGFELARTWDDLPAVEASDEEFDRYFEALRDE